jgi:hypothetical protein
MAGLHDAIRCYDEAFQHASIANALRKGKYDRNLTECLVESFVSYFSRANLRRPQRATQDCQTPVFIVGMPRSGTTLVEQILASHPEVHGAGELDWIFRLWQSAVSRHSTKTARFSRCLERMTGRDVDALAAEYLARLQSLGHEALRVTDKMPTNFMHLGLIAMLFPSARVIYCRRHPRDTCLSCYMTDLAAGNNFSLALSFAGHFYLQCERIMTHWKSELDLRILEVEYEDVVHYTEHQSRRMLHFLDLPWDGQCLRFYENKRPVATASQAQVRRPIYQTSVSRWRHYERHLEGLKASLEFAL